MDLQQSTRSVPQPKRHMADSKMNDDSNWDTKSARSISGTGAKNVPAEEEEEEETLDDAKPKPQRRSTVGWEAGDPSPSEKDSSSGATSGAGTTGATNASADGADDKSSEPPTKSSRRRRSTGEASGASDSKTKQKNKHFEDEDVDTTAIIEIPDLEEEERDPDITTQVAEAPRNANRSVQTLKELDKDIKNALPNASNFGVDLQLLTSVLCPERALVEADDPWTFDTLINEVAQEIQKDTEEREELQQSDNRAVLAAVAAASNAIMAP